MKKIHFFFFLKPELISTEEKTKKTLNLKISFEKYVEKTAKIISKSIINIPPTFVFCPPHSFKDFKV